MPSEFVEEDSVFEFLSLRGDKNSDINFIGTVLTKSVTVACNFRNAYFYWYEMETCEM